MKTPHLFVLLIFLAIPCLPGMVSAQSPEQLAKWLKRFPEADADGDGILTLEEAMVYRKAALSTKPAKPGASLSGTPQLSFDPGWDEPAFPDHAVSRKSPEEILEIYRKGPEARSAPSPPDAMSFPKPDDGGLRIVGVGHSFMAPAYKTLPLITRAAGFEQPLCLHTGGGVTGSARYKWEQENGIFSFDHEPVPKLLAAIANADWEAMCWGAYYSDRPEFYTCWVDYATKYHPGMKFYLSDAWPQIYQIVDLLGQTTVPDSEEFFTEEVLQKLGQQKREQFGSLVQAIREKSTQNVFILPTSDAVTEAAIRFIRGELPGVEGLHQLVGGKERSIWRDQTGHLGPGLERLEGYVFYATLYGKSPELIEEPIAYGGNGTYPNPELDQIFREIAWQAVKNHPLSGVSASE